MLEFQPKQHYRKVTGCFSAGTEIKRRNRFGILATEVEVTWTF
jgi:hypothetical protein